jgi:hypothetical protein
MSDHAVGVLHDRCVVGHALLELQVLRDCLEASRRDSSRIVRQIKTLFASA